MHCGKEDCREMMTKKKSHMEACLLKVQEEDQLVLLNQSFIFAVFGF